MSYTEICVFDRNGDAHLYADIQNAWRGAMAVWLALKERYLPAHSHPGPWRRRIEAVWDLYKQLHIPIHERIVLGTTFDGCLVRKENLPQVIEAFRSFGGETSLPEQADILEQLLEEENCIAVGWNQTSVNGLAWYNKLGYDKEKEKSIPYNCIAGEEHFWLFEDLVSIQQ